MFQNIGVTELIIIFVIVLLIFGPRSLPKIGKSMGKGIREFKDAVHGISEEEDEETKDSEKPKPSDQ